MTDGDVHRGARIYSTPVLGFYDLLVVRLSNSWAWRCPSRLMLDRYDRFLGRHHLDVGPGTGWYLAHAELPAAAEITLLDLNSNSLDRAAARTGGAVRSRVVADVLAPLPDTLGPFDSVAVNYVLHCLPGTWADKGTAIEHLAARLADDGVLFGSTILGRGAGHNLPGRGLMALYNALGIFHNRDDDEIGLETVLRQNFAQVSIDVVGTVAMFSASAPRR